MEEIEPLKKQNAELLLALRQFGISYDDEIPYNAGWFAGSDSSAYATVLDAAKAIVAQGAPASAPGAPYQVTIGGDGFFAGCKVNVDPSLSPDTVEMRGANRVRMNLATGEISEFQGNTPTAANAAGLKGWQPMTTAPMDGTMVRLLVDFTDNATEDSSEPCVTIGANCFNDTGIDQWDIAGWNWQQDCFTAGVGTPLAWLPLIDKAPAADAGGQGSALWAAIENYAHASAVYAYGTVRDNAASQRQAKADARAELEALLATRAPATSAAALSQPVVKLLRWGEPGTSGEAISLRAVGPLPPNGTLLYAAPVAMKPVAVVNDHYSRDGVNDEISAFLPVGTQLYAPCQDDRAAANGAGGQA